MYLAWCLLFTTLYVAFGYYRQVIMAIHPGRGIMRYMQPYLSVIRSIGAHFANRIYVPIIFIAGIVSLVSVGFIVYLGTLHELWLLLLIPVMVVISIAIGVLVVIKLTINAVTPPQTKAQKIAVRAFVDKLSRLSETAQTPKIVLLFRIVRDIAAPKKDGFIGTLASDTTSLKKDFTELTQLFK